MRIALICTEKLPVPPVAGGAVQLYIEGIIPYLSKNHDITVFSISHPGLPAEETNNNIKYVRLPAINKAKYVSGIKSKLTGSFDLVYVFNRPLWVLSLSQDLPETRFGLSLHNEMFHPEKISDEKALGCVERVDFINTVSKFIADGVKNRCPSADSKLNVVYSGVDTGKYSPVWTEKGIRNKNHLKEKYGIQGYRVVLFIGRLSNKKGVDVLIKAMHKVMATHRDVALVIVGSKWYGKNERDSYCASLDILARDLSGPVVLTGFLPPSEIPSHYNLGDVFVCPSQWSEPLARVHYEAMAAGLPIITTNRGGNAEVIKRGITGLVIDDVDSTNNCGNPDFMATYINELLDNPEFALKLGTQSRKLAEDIYCWKRVASDIQNIISNFVPFAVEKATSNLEPELVDTSNDEIHPQESKPDNFFDTDF